MSAEQFETIFRDALYIIFEYPSSYPSLSYLDAKGNRHHVELNKCLDKIFSRLPNGQNPDVGDWHFFYGGMGYYFLVNKKVLGSYMRKTGIDETACEIGLDEKAALETINELQS